VTGWVLYGLSVAPLGWLLLCLAEGLDPRWWRWPRG
jgi:hypothetical protein